MKKINIKSDLLKNLAALPDVRKARNWTLEQDSAILRFYRDKGGPAVARALGIPYATVQKRFQFLSHKVGK